MNPDTQVNNMKTDLCRNSCQCMYPQYYTTPHCLRKTGMPFCFLYLYLYYLFWKIHFCVVCHYETWTCWTSFQPTHSIPVTKWLQNRLLSNVSLTTLNYTVLSILIDIVLLAYYLHDTIETKQVPLLEFDIDLC